MSPQPAVTLSAVWSEPAPEQPRGSWRLLGTAAPSSPSRRFEKPNPHSHQHWHKQQGPFIPKSWAKPWSYPCQRFPDFSWPPQPLSPPCPPHTGTPKLYPFSPLCVPPFTPFLLLPCPGAGWHAAGAEGHGCWVDLRDTVR